MNFSKLLFNTISCIFAISISIISTGCSNEENVIDSSDTDLLSNSKFAAQQHNECLTYILEGIKSNGTRSSEYSTEKLRELTIEYASAYLCHKQEISRAEADKTLETIDFNPDKDINLFYMQMNDMERDFVSRAIEIVSSGSDIESLLVEVSNCSLPKNHIVSVLNFISTLDASKKYWEVNIESWDALTDTYTNLSRSPSADECLQVAAADAYYMWWGSLGTGNPVSGACIGAVGSALTALN